MVSSAEAARGILQKTTCMLLKFSWMHDGHIEQNSENSEYILLLFRIYFFWEGFIFKFISYSAAFCMFDHNVPHCSITRTVIINSTLHELSHFVTHLNPDAIFRQHGSSTHPIIPSYFRKAVLHRSLNTRACM